MNKFKDILKAKRTALGLSQFELGVEMGTSQSKIYDWEKGTYYPHVTSLIKLADYFKCSLDELLGREEKER